MLFFSIGKLGHGATGQSRLGCVRRFRDFGRSAPFHGGNTGSIPAGRAIHQFGIIFDPLSIAYGKSTAWCSHRPLVLIGRNQTLLSPLNSGKPVPSARAIMFRGVAEKPRNFKNRKRL
jgi:hypothetical protein